MIRGQVKAEERGLWGCLSSPRGGSRALGRSASLTPKGDRDSGSISTYAESERKVSIIPTQEKTICSDTTFQYKIIACK